MIFTHVRDWLKQPTTSTVTSLVFVCLVSVSNTLQAGESIDISLALQKTLDKNSTLQAYPFHLRRTEALKLQASLRPTPSVGLRVENVLGSGEYSDSNSAETSLTLSQTIEMGGKRLQRLKFASADIRQQQAEYELTRLDLLAETSRRYYHVLVIQARQSVVTLSISAERQALTVIQQRAKAGAVGQADVSKMDLRLAKSQALAQQLQAEHRLASSRLAAMWQSRVDFPSVAGAFTALPQLPNSDQLLALVEQSPALLNRLALERLQDRRVSLAQANGRSDITVGLGVKQLGATDDQALSFSVSMPLSFSNPNRGRIAAALAERELTVMESEQVKQRLELELLETLQRLESTGQQVDTLRQQLIPKAEVLLADIKRGYQQGRYSVLQWTDAQAERVTLEQAQINLLHSFYLQLLELERITGQPLALAKEGASS